MPDRKNRKTRESRINHENPIQDEWYVGKLCVSDHSFVVSGQSECIDYSANTTCQRRMHRNLDRYLGRSVVGFRLVLLCLLRMMIVIEPKLFLFSRFYKMIQSKGRINSNAGGL
jgi:hypothetical protein